MAKKPKIIIVLLSLLVFYKCAHEVYPTGGEVDKKPPEIIETYPENYQTNFNSEKIIFSFNEYLDERTSLNSIYFSPDISDAVEKYFSGKDLIIEIPDTALTPNTTFIITLGTDISDYNNGNKLAEPFIYAFSTGNEISKVSVSGYVYDENPQGTLIGAYPLDSLFFEPDRVKPKYVSQAGENGKYILRGLSKGKYRLFAIKDDFRDMIYNPTNDMFGVTFEDLIIQSPDTIITGMNFKLSIEDTLQPSISNVTMTDKNHLLVEFTEEIDISFLVPENFSIVDNNLNKVCTNTGVFKGKAKENSVFVTIDCFLSDSVQYSVLVDTLRDLSGNVKIKDLAEFVINEKPDTNKLSLRFEFNNNENKLDVDYRLFNLIFDDALNNSLDEIKKSIKISDNGMGLNYRIFKKDNAIYKIKILDKLKNEHEYQFELNFGNLRDFAGNRTDSTIIRKIVTFKDYSYTGLYGEIVDIDFTNPVLRLESVDKKHIYQQVVTDDKKFAFEKVFPGKYLLMMFKDENNDLKLNTGYINPFQFSEKFIYSKDTLNLRPRWPVANYKLKFNNEQL